jgi:hypothetical protein
MLVFLDTAGVAMLDETEELGDAKHSLEQTADRTYAAIHNNNSAAPIVVVLTY